ncbi:MAG: diguanylate cyclase [Deltaproteobacteria bacterium]|nr:diguanylate cyclase [Deltaproteobacteria bacterium]
MKSAEPAKKSVALEPTPPAPGTTGQDAVREKEDNFPVLIAEDNSVSRRLLEKNLERAGHRVVSASNGREAFDLFRKQFCPMVITDWMMPEMDGVELCKAIRADQSQGYVFIVFLTSKDTKEDIITALEAGADDYLTKPFHRAELIARLKTGKRVLDLERSLKKANEEIRIMSITDPLTGLFNRGYLMDRLPEELNRAKRYNHPLSLVICDIDRFKNVNDTYGHLAGDEVLRRLATCLKGSVREGIDWIARYGGEEFFIVLCETELQGAMAFSERLRRTIMTDLSVVWEGHRISVTASFGITNFTPSTDQDISTEALIKEADRCLYLAKEEGRNRVRGGC